jgi:DNA-binding NarL/FixJ family response regulator
MELHMEGRQAQRVVIHIAAVDQDPVRLVGIRSILDTTVDLRLTVMPVSSLAVDQSVDLVLVGNHCGVKFFETMGRLRALCPNLRAIVTGSGSDDEKVLMAMRYGAKGYIDDSRSTSQLTQAIYSVHKGSVWAPRRVISMLIEGSDEVHGPRRRSLESKLTSREEQVLGLLVSGRRNKEIGGFLGIRERTVKAHMSKLMRKLGVKNRIALSVHAVNHSLVPAL